MFADQEGVKSGCAKLINLRPVLDAALTHAKSLSGMRSASRSDVSSVTWKVWRFRLLTPTIAGSDSSAASNSELS